MTPSQTPPHSDKLNKSMAKPLFQVTSNELRLRIPRASLQFNTNAQDFLVSSSFSQVK